MCGNLVGSPKHSFSEKLVATNTATASTIPHHESIIVPVIRRGTRTIDASHGTRMNID
jgi:hypothetical protein